MPSQVPDFLPSADTGQGSTDWGSDFVNLGGRAPNAQQRYAPPPRDFSVDIATDGVSLLYSLTDVYNSSIFPNISRYKFWFAPMTLVNQTTIAASGGSNAAFKKTTFVGSVASPNLTGKVVTWQDKQNFNIDGWYWCTTSNKDGVDGYPTLPVRAPVGRFASGCPDVAPVDVSGQTAVLTATTFESQAVISVFVNAVIPDVATSPTFAGYQIYFDNYFQVGVGTLRDGPAFYKTSTQVGTGLSGTFLLYPDSPPNHQVKFYFVAISPCGVRTATPTTSPSVTFATGIH